MIDVVTLNNNLKIQLDFKEKIRNIPNMRHFQLAIWSQCLLKAKGGNRGKSREILKYYKHSLELNNQLLPLGVNRPIEVW